MGLPGFEPGLVDSESTVLPLHHKPSACVYDVCARQNFFYNASTGNRTRTSCLEGTNSNH